MVDCEVRLFSLLILSDRLYLDAISDEGVTNRGRCVRACWHPSCKALPGKEVFMWFASVSVGLQSKSMLSAIDY